MRHVTRLNECLALMMAGLMVLAGAGRALAQDQVSDELSKALQAAPADAAIVMGVPNIGRASQKLATMNEAMGLGVPQLGDALGALKAEAGITKGLRDGGALFVIIPDAQDVIHAMEAGSEPTALGLLPVTNFDEFVANFAPQDVAGGLKQLVWGDGETVFARSIGGYALVSDRQQAVADYKPGNAESAMKMLEMAGTVGAKQIASGDMFVYMNMAAFAKPMREGLAKIMEQAKAEMANAPADVDPAMQKMAMAILDVEVKLLDAVIRDASAAVMAMTMDDRGIALSMAGQAKPGSEVAGYLAKAGGAAKLMSKLPDAKYMFATSMDLQGLNMGDMMAKMVEMLPEDAAWFGKMVESATPLMAKTQGISQMFASAGGGAAGIAGLNSAFSGLSVIASDDPKGYVVATKAYIEELGKLKIKVDPQFSDMTFISTYTDNVMQIEGVQVDQYQVMVQLPPEMLARMGQAGMMIMLSGATNSTGYLAVVGDHVVMTSTANPEQMKMGIAALKAGKPGLGAQGLMKQVRAAGLPANPVMEMYISISGVMEAVGTMMQAFGQPMPFQAPANLPPVAMGVGVEDGGAVQSLYLPMPVIAFMKDLAMQAQAGGFPGQPGGQAPPPAPF